jgi:hypothetical protein
VDIHLREHVDPLDSSPPPQGWGGADAAICRSGSFGLDPLLKLLA